jgi:hypothetical protein
MCEEVPWFGFCTFFNRIWGTYSSKINFTLKLSDNSLKPSKVAENPKK